VPPPHWPRPRNAGSTRPLVWAAGEGWHPGVVGIVASRLKEATNRPAVVIGFDGDEGKGSGRSVSGVDLGASIQRLAAEGLIKGRRAQDGGGADGGTRAAGTRRWRGSPSLLARQGAGDRARRT
jgi:single-stranded-DNA-specific exonuclease